MDLVIKSLPANAGDGGNEGLISGVRKMPWRRAWQFILVFLCVCVCVCVFKSSFIVIWLTYHTNHSFKVCNSMAFSVFTDMNFKYICCLKKKPHVI